MHLLPLSWPQYRTIKQTFGEAVVSTSRSPRGIERFALRVEDAQEQARQLRQQADWCVSGPQGASHRANQGAYRSLLAVARQLDKLKD